MLKMLLVFRKSLMEMWREPQLTVLTLLFPLFMLIITYFGYNAPKLATHPVVVFGADQPGAAALVDRLRAQRYGDGRPMFAVQIEPDSAEAAATAALKTQAITVLLRLTTGADGAAGDGTLRATLVGDATSMRFITASTLLQNLLTQYLDAAAGKPEVVKISEEPFALQSAQTDFDLYAPGMMLFAILMLTPQAAMLVAREVRWGTLRRLRLSSLRAWELLTGLSLAQMVVAVGLVGVMFACAALLGFHNHGSVWLALGISLLVSFSAIGFGLMVACISNNDGDALNLGGMVTMLQVFLSGAFFALPPLTVFSVAGYEIGAFDFIPATHGLLALQQVLISGASLGQVAVRLGLTLGLSVFYFGLGVLVFNWRQMRLHA
jgi:ABC-2 type transport system permease protein